MNIYWDVQTSSSHSSSPQSCSSSSSLLHLSPFHPDYSQVSESAVTQSYLTLCDPMDCSPPGSSIHGILQARILEWVAISFSKSVSPINSLNFPENISFLYSQSHRLIQAFDNPWDVEILIQWRDMAIFLSSFFLRIPNDSNVQKF